MTRTKKAIYFLFIMYSGFLKALEYEDSEYSDDSILVIMKAEQKLMDSSCGNLLDLMSSLNRENIYDKSFLNKKDIEFSKSVLEDMQSKIYFGNDQFDLDSIKTHYINYGFYGIDDGSIESDIEPSKISLVGQCEIIDSVLISNSHLNINVDAKLTEWKSNQAEENQENYDNTPYDFLKNSYGFDGIGFGDHIKSGVWLHYPYSLPMEESRIDDSIALLWDFEEIEINNSMLTMIPDSVEKWIYQGWSDSCKSIEITFSLYPDFSNADRSIVSKDDSCFSNDDFIKSIKNNNHIDNQALLRLLGESQTLNEYFIPIDQYGKPIRCDERNKFSNLSCSRQVFNSFKNSFLDFFSARQDLYIKIKFDDFITKKYLISSSNNSITELESFRELKDIESKGHVIENQSSTEKDSSTDVENETSTSDTETRGEDSTEYINILHVSESVVQPHEGALACHDLMERVNSMNVRHQLGMESLDLEKLTFSSALNDSDGYINVDGKSIKTNIVYGKNYEYRVIPVLKEYWNAHQNISGDIYSYPISGFCSLPDQVRLFNPNVRVDIPQSMISWSSSEAINNQHHYDNEPSEVWKTLYGYDGLGFGEYAKGGIWLSFPREVSGYIYNMAELAFHWQFKQGEELDINNLPIPSSISTVIENDWYKNASNISLRIASNRNFVNSSVTVGRYIRDNNAQYFFQKKSYLDLGYDFESGFIDKLRQADKINTTMFLRDSYNRQVICDREDLVSLDGCSQPIVLSFEPILRGFMLGEHNLYVEVSFDDNVMKYFEVSKIDGSIKDLH